MAKSVRHWSLCYRLVMAGLCQRPTSENWCLGFLAHGRWVGFHSPVTSPDQHLSDPVFVERELWRLFEIEGTSVLSFTNLDRFSRGRRWATALLTRAAEGKIPRARLLDATLDALQRDFVQYRAGWFAELHRDLEPSIAERVDRLDRYLTLLASRIPPTVSFALDALVALERAGEPSAPARAEPAPAAARAPTGAPEAPLRRARSLDDAIDLLAGAIERFDAADEMEGALDGVARFCGDRPPDFALRLKPLTKRAGTILGAEPGPAFSGYDLRGDLCTLALAWSGNQAVRAARSERLMRSFTAGIIRTAVQHAQPEWPTWS